MQEKCPKSPEELAESIIRACRGDTKPPETAVHANAVSAAGGAFSYSTQRGILPGVLKLDALDALIPCFTPGTMIATVRGERQVEDLRPGDRIVTRDNGIQELRWIGTRPVDWKLLKAHPDLTPILLQKGSLGNGLPERDILVSPSHKLLLAGEDAQQKFGEPELLVDALHLMDRPGVHRVETLGVIYIHLLFDRHEVLLSNGAWSESFQATDQAVAGLSAAQRSQVFELVPDLASGEGARGQASARPVAKRSEMRTFTN